jgi:hypothetical protein
MNPLYEPYSKYENETFNNYQYNANPNGNKYTLFPSSKPEVMLQFIAGMSGHLFDTYVAMSALVADAS